MAHVVTVLVAAIGFALIVVPARRWESRTIRDWLDECGLVTISTANVAIAVGAVALTVVGIVSILVPIPVVAPIAGVAAIAIPVALLDAARTRRQRAAAAAWPGIIDAIRMALRAGLPIHDALRSSQTHVPAQWRSTWSDSVNLAMAGAPVRVALRDLRRGLADPVGDRLCETIDIAIDVGGTELPTVLDDLARSVRAEQMIRREAVARQSWVKHAARLGAAAPWIVVVMLGTRQDARESFGTPAGAALLIACAGATVVAYILMTALGRLPETVRTVSDA